MIYSAGPLFCVPLFCKASPYTIFRFWNYKTRGLYYVLEYKNKGPLFCKRPLILYDFRVMKLQLRGPAVIYIKSK